MLLAKIIRSLFKGHQPIADVDNQSTREPSKKVKPSEDFTKARELDAIVESMTPKEMLQFLRMGDVPARMWLIQRATVRKEAQVADLFERSLPPGSEDYASYDA